MKRTIKTITHILIAITTATFFSCPSFSEPNNLALLKHEIRRYHDSGLYEKELKQVLSQAQDYILKQVKINKHRENPQKLAIVLDIDETSLSNYTKITLRDFTNNHKQIHQEILAANSPAIPATLTLYHAAQKNGVHIFFVSGRVMSELKATRNNLLRAGFANWAGLYLRPDNYHQASIIPFKTRARKSITDQGYTVIASIGDQYSDLEGGYTQKVFKLPNPFYHIS
ncbi:acid phosphatase, class B [Legionella lansingensis]|uniref:Acid phosphatase, class B n=1 Tax=Legionella lansingensis TaxID=45067 RepID=A0A0W0VVC3_9GAMM|nr:HAD family acid phosphatase [Legionella lansingensis]KTD23638.1 acid phosphatase, class B [Legionella lansingensis]SNV52497.1 acid phosphatase, class B [Legionella lansingensis]